jgi:predicted transposase/invertase (TIGR01784 family)
MTTRPDLCHELLELIIGHPVGKFVAVDAQKAIKPSIDGKGVRFDVYSEDEEAIYDCEMQTGNYSNLPKRSRYYQGMIDLGCIESGADYSSLKKTFVIFICKDDCFGQKRHQYTFLNLCKEDPHLPLGDEAYKIFLCAEGEQNDVSPKMQAFLAYVAGKLNDHPFVKELDEEVKQIKENQNWRVEFMNNYAREMDLLREGREQGLIEGRNEERKEFILSMLRDGKSAESIADFCSINVSEVRQVEKDMLMKV